MDKSTSALVKLLKDNAASAGAIVAVILGWEASFWALRIPLIFIVPPSMIINSLMEKSSLYLGHTWVTVYETVIGFLLATAVGIALAILIVYSKVLERTLYPLLVSAQVIPKVAIAPILLIWMGYGPVSKIAIAALIAFFPIVIDMAHGLAAVEADMLDLARSNMAKNWSVFANIRIKHSLPYLFSGLKVGITLAVIGAIVGEFVGATVGLGYLITVANYHVDTVTMFASVMILVAIGMLFFVAIVLIERLTIPWYFRMRIRG